MSRYGLWGMAAAAALMMAPSARAADEGHRGDPGQTNGSSDAVAKSGVSHHDNTDLIPPLYSANIAEIESAKIAQKNAQSQAVKDFAKQMESDHKDMADSLKKLADNRKLKLDDDAARKQHQAQLDQMKDLKGAAFDQHFTHMIVAEQEKDLNDVKMALEQAKKSGDNELTAVLQHARTTMEGHHRMAMDLDRNKGSDMRQGRRGSDTSSTAPSSTRSNSSEADRPGAAGTTGTTDMSGGTSHSSSSPSDTHGGSSSSDTTSGSSEHK